MITLDGKQPIIPKDPDSVEPKVINWSAKLDEWSAIAGDDVTIDDFSFTVAAGVRSDGTALTSDATPLVIDEDSIVDGGLKTQLRYSGGTVGATYPVRCSIVGTDDSVCVRRFRVRVKQR